MLIAVEHISKYSEFPEIVQSNERKFCCRCTKTTSWQLLPIQYHPTRILNVVFSATFANHARHM